MNPEGGEAARTTISFRLLCRLTAGPQTPTELASFERKHLSVISRCLGNLRQEGLVECARASARLKYYRPTLRGYLLVYASIRRGG
ncbi:MAG: hypothetical protein JRN51_08315 [Nitrososphaerota archaeon]|nr:hypothetical protein [Nitrososphaerota archaeon]